MISIGLKKQIYLVSYNKKVQIWYYNFKYITNAWIIYILKQLLKIGDCYITYNLAKIYINPKVFESQKFFKDNNLLHIKFKLKIIYIE